MKYFNIFFIMFVFISMVSCNGQVRSDYQITFDTHPQAVKYLVFLEERTTNTGFALKDSADYLEPINLTQYKIAEVTTANPVIVNLLNDGKYLKAGVVVVDAAGFYSVMGCSQVYRKGLIPSKPVNISITKK
ncbi:MAG: hypothetical protein QXG00_04120 [Candidatus Woesearchaeota archaeon]